MATKPDYDFTKLPKWTQEYIANIEREREMAIRSLNEYVDNQTPSNFWVDDIVCIGEEGCAPSFKRNYIQTHSLKVQVGKSEVSIVMREENALDISTSCGIMRFQPIASNSIRIEEPRR